MQVIPKKMSAKMCAILIYCIVLEASAIPALNPRSDPAIVTRSQWNARPPKATEEMPNPVPFVVVHHSYVPAACNTSEECVAAMQWMQNYHQDERKWWDIGYSFAAGGDGRVYEGRGWSTVGAHAPKYNNISIGICVIGDWTESLPPEIQLQVVKKLIDLGVREGKIAKNYKLVGHRQVREGTTCPGERLFDEIRTWPHFTKNPDYTKYQKKAIITAVSIPEFQGNKLKKRNLVGDTEEDKQLS